MDTFISMLRGINVSGQKRMLMGELKGLYESLGPVNVRTYVQSGNVVFDSPEENPVKLAESIEAGIERAFGFSVAVFLRDARDFERVIASNPFLKRNTDPAKLHVTFLYSAPPESALRVLAVSENSSDEFLVGDNEIFLFCPNGYGQTKLSNNFFERKLKVAATTRNWNTVNVLHKLALGEA
ncbi:MAG: DUF1697 domain-containing protein [Chloroflexi bacterium]|nr:DUF1697 domain-containing protein [Chloroflexota bacterium]